MQKVYVICLCTRKMWCHKFVVTVDQTSSSPSRAMERNLGIIFALVLTKIKIDGGISAEISHRTVDPELLEVVTTNMIHFPCGLNYLCMVEGKCSKRFPKKIGLRYSDVVM